MNKVLIERLEKEVNDLKTTLNLVGLSSANDVFEVQFQKLCERVEDDLKHFSNSIAIVKPSIK